MSELHYNTAVKMFTEGRCHELALALYQHLPHMSLVVIETGGTHAGVTDYVDWYDIEGKTPYNDALAEWDVYSDEDVSDFGDDVDGFLDRTSSFGNTYRHDLYSGITEEAKHWANHVIDRLI